MASDSKPVLILGAGINGCALARELALNGQSVWVVDAADIASGATSGSSRLIHGGLRYLEYGEFDLVKESVAERTRLLRLAPQFVRPLRLWIPATSRFGGTIGAIGRFFGWQWWPQPKAGRGAALVGAGLALYDAYARDATVPKHACGSTSAPDAPAVDRSKYRRLCSYYDGQVLYPERLVLAMLEDAQRISAERGLDFRVFTYHEARLLGKTVDITATAATHTRPAMCNLEPACVVNATGAWVDHTLKRLQVASKRLMGGTKGSHFFSFSPRLRAQLNGQGIYAEAGDGRPIFILPFDDAVLVGTTDMKFDGPPQDARATDGELQYLLEAVDSVLPEARLTQSDVAFHYSAVRPLPYVEARSTGAITRRHSIVRHDATVVPIFSIVGGKLTTMRSLAEQAAAMVFAALGRPVTANSRDRLFPGAEDYPHDSEQLAVWQRNISERTGFSVDAVSAIWKLCGTRAESLLAGLGDATLLPDTPFPRAFVRRVIDEEHVHGLVDLVERRLMLLYHQRLTRATLTSLAELLADAGRLDRLEVDKTVDAEVERLKSRYGKHVE